MSRELIQRLYAALERGDRDGIVALLHEEFVARFADGLPYGVGGTHRGLAAIDDGWWALGRHYRVRAEPREWIDCADGRLLVLGHYTGQARVTKLPVEAGYAHLFTERDARLAELVQFTDTAVWRAAAGLQ